VKKIVANIVHLLVNNVLREFCERKTKSLELNHNTRVFKHIASSELHISTVKSCL